MYSPSYCSYALTGSWVTLKAFAYTAKDLRWPTGIVEETVVEDMVEGCSARVEIRTFIYNRFSV